MSVADEEDLRAAFDRLTAPPSMNDFVLRPGREATASPARSWRAALVATLAVAVAVATAAVFVGLRTMSQPGLVGRTASTPPARSEAAMAYDSTSGVTVMFGGVGAQRQPLADTWEWDGRGWSVVDGGGPPALTAARMTDDPVDRGVLLVGTDSLHTAVPCPAGTQVAGAHPPEPFVLPCLGPTVETWVFSSGAWRMVAATLPAPAGGATLATVPSTGEVVAIAPLPASSGCAGGDVTVCPAAAPATGVGTAPAALPRCIAGPTGLRSLEPDLALDACGPAHVAWQTWVFRHGSWAVVPSDLVTAGPTAALLTVAGGQDKLVFDAEPTPLAAFCNNTGGGCPGVGTASAWTWNGDGWTPAAGVPPIPAITGAAESTSGTETLVYTQAGDTWEGSPSGWTERTVFGPSDPGPRVGEALARDRTGHVVMFGGYSPAGIQQSAPSAQTWVWDETSWVLVSSPPPATR